MSVRGTKRRRWRGAALIGAVIAVIAAVVRIRHVARNPHLAHRTPPHGEHRPHGWRWYDIRLATPQPDPDVSDLVLADRVRSILGPLEKRLDLPHVHVMVQDHTVLLHGDVDTVQHKSAIERAVAGISGVEAVQSHLQLGLLHSDTRPSEGTRHQRPSPARTKLILAVEAAGVGESDAPRAVHAVTQVLRQRLPEEIWDHLLRHLPSDVQDLVEPAPVETAATARKVRTVPDFVSEVCAADGVPPAVALNVTTAVLGALKELVPEEVAGVGAVLPEELRHLWQAAGV